VPVSGKILNLDLALNINHTSFCDLVIYLDNPAGQSACINLYDVYTFVPNRAINGWIILDEESVFGIDQTSDFFLTLFKPNGDDRLSVFYNQQSGGIWRVRIQDAIYSHTGTIKDVRMDMLINPEPSAFLLLTGGILFVRKSHDNLKKKFVSRR
jgi:subtilisin-like proprotein convertase family protein